MTGYEEFIGKIKEWKGEADYDRMYARIEQRVSRRRAGVRLALVGTLVVLLFAFAGYYYYPSQHTKGEVLMSYVFEQESVDGPILDYVFSREGTIFD